MHTQEPVFIHAWWRSASTYIWARLRRDSRLRCYYEPLNEMLGKLSASVPESPHDFTEQLRHPGMGSGQFAEYAGLVERGELRYMSQLAYHRFLLLPGEADEALLAHLQALIRDAGGTALRPVMCFCRSQMRSAWMKANLGGVHVAQVRNPLSQFESFQSAKYFPARMLLIAVHLCRRMPRAFEHLPRFQRQALAGPAGASLAAREVLPVFALLWLASTLQALHAADFVLDVDRVSTDPGARGAAEKWFDSQAMTLDLSDCAAPGSLDASTSMQERHGVFREAAQALRTHASGLVVFDAKRVSATLDSLSSLSRTVVEEAIRAAPA